MARELGVSRTPLRHALAGLERDGFVENRPGSGFFVTPVHPEEAREIYELLAELEPLAVGLSEAPDAERMRALRRVNDELATAEGTEEAVQRNLVWHQLLTEGCPNGRLREIIVSLRTQARRYEHLYYAPGAPALGASAALHRRILDALESGDLDSAREVLRQHWLTDLDRLSTGDAPERGTR